TSHLIVRPSCHARASAASFAIACGLTSSRRKNSSLSLSTRARATQGASPLWSPLSGRTTCSLTPLQPGGMRMKRWFMRAMMPEPLSRGQALLDVSIAHDEWGATCAQLFSRALAFPRRDAPARLLRARSEGADVRALQLAGREGRHRLGRSDEAGNL